MKALTEPAASQSDEQLARCPLFAGFSPEQLASVAALMTPRLLEPGALLVREGEAAEELFVIHQGSVEVTKRATTDGHDFRIATLHDGATLGEMTFLDRAPRSATVRALARTTVGVVSMDRLERLAAADRGIEQRMLRNLGTELSRRLRFTNGTTVAALEEQLELERTRALMGRFVIFLAFMMVTYTFILKLAIDTLPGGIGPSTITIPITFVYAGALYALMRRSRLTLDFFGLTLRRVGPVVSQALVWTAGMCALTAAFKLALIWWAPSFAGQPLFSLGGLLDPETTWPDLRTSLMLAAVYAAVGPLQEFIVRSGLQTALQRCLVGPSAAARAIVVSNALFASAHLHLSVSFAIVSFFPGLLWGTLFARQRHIVGVSVSHILCGWFGFLIVGFEPWY